MHIITYDLSVGESGKTGEDIQVIQEKIKLKFSFPCYRIFPIKTTMKIQLKAWMHIC